MNKTKIFSLGFTLIELLVVISIIGILAGIGVGRYSAAEKQARDAQRKSDLNQYRIALENYSSAYSLTYPNVTCGNVEALCSFIPTGGSENFQTTYLAGGCLQDPRPTNDIYYYCSDGLQYVLWTNLESSGWFEVCSNGRSGALSTDPATNGIENPACDL